MKKEKVFTSTIWILSFVSLFNDIGSEILIPVMPIYLTSIGFTAIWIGLVEGVAEAFVGVSKGYFGKRSDDRGKRLPFIQLGYALSAFAKPLMAVFANPIWVIFIRGSDRLGKGIRTSARDAMLSDECSKENKGKVFGLHRTMDTIGAAIGPVLALVFLFYYPGQYKLLFLLTFFPGILTILLTLFIKEKQLQPVESKIKGNFFSFFNYWKTASSEYKKVVMGLVAFAIFNSSDVFLLLMAKHIGLSDLHVIGVYIFYNFIYAICSLPFGALSDRIGMKSVYLFGLTLFVIVYTGMAFITEEKYVYVLFFIYGIYAAATEGVSKAWVSKIVLPSETATAIGFLSSCSSIATMLASMITGLFWVMISPSISFIISGVGVGLVIIYFSVRTNNKSI